MRDILEDFANNIGIDPLVPDDWYKIKDTQFSSDTVLNSPVYKKKEIITIK